jgi:hypothetical protein
MTRKNKEFVKFDEGKPQLAYLPTREVEQIMKVLDYGANKYERDNWKKPHDTNRMLSSLLRHVFAFMRGEVTDEESGHPHLAHAGCCILMLMWHINNKKGVKNVKKG